MPIIGLAQPLSRKLGKCHQLRDRGPPGRDDNKIRLISNTEYLKASCRHTHPLFNAVVATPTQRSIAPKGLFRCCRFKSLSAIRTVALHYK